MSKIAILIPAAGASSRMGGRDKLLEQVQGQPLLSVVVQRACQTGADVIVALPGPDHPRAALLDGCNVTVVFVADASDGMGHSIQAAAGHLAGHHSAAMVLPADMPDITLRDLERLLEANAETPANAILRGAAEDGTPGHPVLFPARHFAALQNLSSDQGAREILKAFRGLVRLVPLPDRHALTDLDTPEDWHNWRAAAKP